MKNIIAFSILCFIFSGVRAQNSGTCPSADNARAIDGPAVIETHYVPDTSGTERPQRTVAAAGDRTIYWIPGLGLSVWKQSTLDAVDHGDPVSGFQARKTRSLTYLYNESLDFATASSTLQTNITNTANPSTDRRDDFIIAHSQGGLVSRTVDKNIVQNVTPPLFGGIVTFGTPHQGAAIIDNLGAKLNGFMNTVCLDLSEGPIREADAGFPFHLFGVTGFATQLRNTLCTQIGGTVSTLANMKTGALAQYYKTSNNTYLNGPSGLNNFTLQNTVNNPLTAINSVAFYGVENTNGICFRVLAAYASDNGSSDPAFQDDLPDNTALNSANTAMTAYVTKRNLFNNLLNALQVQLVTAIATLDPGVNINHNSSTG